MPASQDQPTAARRQDKSALAFRTISEVAEELNVPQHVLRFWESKFSQVRPLKRGGGRRYYRPEDIALLRRIRDLLYREGYTIKGVQRLLREGGVKAAAGTQARPADTETGGAAAEPMQTIRPDKRAELESLVDELTALRDLLRQQQG